MPTLAYNQGDNIIIKNAVILKIIHNIVNLYTCKIGRLIIVEYTEYRYLVKEILSSDQSVIDDLTDFR
jgi:hypothetical protein